jgi:hypothetical protein
LSDFQAGVITSDYQRGSVFCICTSAHQTGYRGASAGAEAARTTDHEALVVAAVAVAVRTA